MSLRKGVKFHNGDELTAEDVAFTYGPERMFGNTTPTGLDKTLTSTNDRVVQKSKQLPQQVPPVARRLWPSLVKVEVVGAPKRIYSSFVKGYESLPVRLS